jgi:hypothetical protein
MFVADAASAAAFPLIRFDADANGGSFRSAAKNDANRGNDVAKWATAARGQIDAQLAAVVPGDGVDLVGGIELCARLLRDEDDGATIALVASGVHRTVDLDVATEPARADELRSLVERAVDGRLRLDLYSIGRVDRAATDGPVARDVIEPVVRAWTDACADLGTRCRIHGPSTDRSTKGA